MIIQCQRPKRSKPQPKGQTEMPKKQGIIRVLKQVKTGEIKPVETPQTQFDILPLREVVQSHVSETRTKLEALKMLGG